MIDLIDTHQHLLYRDRLAYAWSDNLPELAGRDFTVDDYQDLTRGRGVKATIFMEVDADDHHAETRFISKVAGDQDNRIAGIISSCRPETDEGFEAWLEECADLPVVGFRRILHEVPDEVSQHETFRGNVRKIGQRGKVFDMVYRADQLGIAHDFASHCDDMILVLDHCGVPDIAGGDIDHWKTAVSKLATLPHVNAKLSGVLAYCAPGTASLDVIHPYIQHVIESFGPDRLVWGSDWPVVNLRSALPDWIDIFRELISGLSDAEQEKMCRSNAVRLYGLGQTYSA